MKEKTLLVIAPSTGKDCVFTLLVAATGEGLASHHCSNEGFAREDLCFGRPERMKAWRERFGEFEVKFLNETGITEDLLISRNTAWYEKNHLPYQTSDEALPKPKQEPSDVQA